MVLSVLAMLLLLVAAAVGALRAVDPFDLLGTSATGAQMTLTMGAAFVGAMAGTLWWGDRIFGRVSSQGLGLLAGLAAVVGVLLLGVADLLSGFMGQNDFTGASVAAAGSPDSGVDALNLVALVGTVLLLVGAIGWFANGIRRLTGVAAPADPWGGHTLEWAADPSSVEVTSERPLLDALENPGVTS
jgi:heme/copper-type cytochrome/quinol oxidase subunit 1